MKFWLYQLTGDKRYLDKTPFITPLYNEGEINEYFDGVIIDDTSVIEPTFKFSRHNYWKKCNYIFCQDSLRYYYVTDVTMSHGFVYVKCHVDVLMTFRNALKERYVIIKRASKTDSVTKKPINYNTYLNDDKFKAYASEMNRSIEFPNQGFDKYTTEFVMCVVGNTSNDVEPEGGENNG